ncbi:MAG TPA: phage head closure protein [Planctomycetota bacterium]|nr:phage head closure protein [Planctomycetota bacterium]
MRAGARRHRLTIQRLVPSATFGIDPTWTTHAEVWGSVEPLRGGELLRAQQVQSEVTGGSGIPYVLAVTPAMRFLCGSRVYQILAVIDPGERHRELQLLWKEQTPA